MGWNFGVLNKDSGVRKTLEEMENDYNRLLSVEAETQQEVAQNDDYDYDDR